MFGDIAFRLCECYNDRIPGLVYKMLQQIQNMAAKLVLERKCGDSASEFLPTVKLVTHQRIKCKILTLTHGYIHKWAPNYLQDLLTEVPHQGSILRSSNMYKKLVVPITKHWTFADGSFCVCAQKWWNSLPNSIKTVEDPTQFTKDLKTYLFKEAYTLSWNLTYLKLKFSQ